MDLRTAVVLGSAFPLTAETLECADPMFRVTGEDPLVVDRACQVATLVREKLASCGVSWDRPIEIRLLDRVVGKVGDCLGLYHCGEDTIDVLNSAAMSNARAAGSSFSSISDSAFWESMIATS